MNFRRILQVMLLIAQFAVGIIFDEMLQPPVTMVSDLNIPGVVECKPLRGGGFDTNCVERNGKLIRSYLLTVKPEPATPAEQRRLLTLPIFFVLGIAAFATTWRVFGIVGAVLLAAVYLVGWMASALDTMHLYLTAFAWILAAVGLALLPKRNPSGQSSGPAAE